MGYVLIRQFLEKDIGQAPWKLSEIKEVLCGDSLSVSRREMSSWSRDVADTNTISCVAVSVYWKSFKWMHLWSTSHLGLFELWSLNFCNAISNAIKTNLKSQFAGCQRLSIFSRWKEEEESKGPCFPSLTIFKFSYALLGYKNIKKTLESQMGQMS